MKRIFADTYYWIALLSPKDEGHAKAIAISSSIAGCVLVTTDEVLSEVLTFFGRQGASARRAAVALVEHILADDAVLVHPQSRDSFLAGLSLYRSRPDKGFSLIDCIVMTAMRREGIDEVLTHDEHFSQEGFQTLL